MPLPCASGRIPTSTMCKNGPCACTEGDSVLGERKSSAAAAAAAAARSSLPCCGQPGLTMGS